MKYFDNVKSEVDIKAQQLMRDGWEDILEANLLLIKSIEKLDNANNDRLNDLDVLATIRPNEITGQYDKEAIKADLANGFCVFIRSEELDESIKIDNPIGLLIETDWYLDENQLNYIK